MKVQKENNQDIYSFVLKHYGNVTYIGMFLNDNSIDDIETFNNSSIGTYYNVFPLAKPVINNNLVLIPNPYKYYENNKVSKLINQNFFDFMLTNYGSLDKTLTFILENTDFTFANFHNNLTNVYTINNLETNKVLAVYNKYNYKVVTGEDETGADFNDDFNISFLI